MEQRRRVHESVLFPQRARLVDDLASSKWSFGIEKNVIHTLASIRTKSTRESFCKAMAKDTPANPPPKTTTLVLCCSIFIDDSTGTDLESESDDLRSS